MGITNPFNGSIGASENHLGEVGGRTSAFSANLTLLSPTTTAYTKGDAVGAAFQITNAARIAAGTGLLQSISLQEILPSTAYLNQAVTVDSTTDKITLTAHGLVNGNLIFINGSTLPTGATAGATVYVISATTNDFQVSNTLGGIAIDFTSNGTSVTITQIATQLAVSLILFDSSPTTTDNSQFNPTSAEIATSRVPIPLISTYQVLGNHGGISLYPIGLPYACPSGSTSLWGVFQFTGASGLALAAGSTLKVRIGMLLD